MTRKLIASAACAAVLIAAPTAFAAPRRPLPSHAQAVAALKRAEDLRAGRGAGSGIDVSSAFSQLYVALPALGGSDRLKAQALLARPDDSDTDPPNTHKWSGPEDSKSPYCVAHFCIHWPKNGTDAPDMTDANHDQVPDYIEQMASIFEGEVYSCENGDAAKACGLSGSSLTGTTPGLAWRPPAPDAGKDGGDQLDVYIEDLFPSKIFGYVAIDAGQPQDPAVPHFAYMVMDKDFSRFANGDAVGGLADERVTAAHEYNHVLQNGYDYLEDQWMFEATAVWMEEQVYPDVNDYLQYLPDWVANPGQPLTTFSHDNLKQYGSGVWNHWLSHRFGAAVVRAAWEDSVANANFAPAAYNAAIIGAGGAGFSDEFGRFSAAVAEWQTPDAGFPDRYPDVARNGSLPIGNVTAPFGLAHTTFAYFDVPAPAGVPVIRLLATLPVDTAGAVALVGRTGGDATAGTVTSNVTAMGAGGTGGVTLSDPGSFGRITAVVINSDFANVGFDQNADDYIYAHDAGGVTAQVDAPGPPVVTSGAPQSVADHAATATGIVDPHLLDTTWSIEYGTTTQYGSRTALQSLPASDLTPVPVSAPLIDLRAKTTYHYRVIASNAAGQVVGGDVSFETAADVTRPTLILTAKKRQRIGKVRARGLVFTANVSEPVTGSAEVRLGKRLAKRFGLPAVLGTARMRLAATAKPTTLRVRLQRRVVMRLGNIRKLAVELVVNVADASRNRSGARRRVLLVH